MRGSRAPDVRRADLLDGLHRRPKVRRAAAAAAAGRQQDHVHGGGLQPRGEPRHAQPLLRGQWHPRQLPAGLPAGPGGQGHPVHRLLQGGAGATDSLACLLAAAGSSPGCLWTHLLCVPLLQELNEMNDVPAEILTANNIPTLNTVFAGAQPSIEGGTCCAVRR
ncbi:hypothetical protein ON010_g7049 [Phytophthora cinnamomi]|nr:hypothetical protein ON010_g7049 [Phytophthora cinnamomi]